MKYYSDFTRQYVQDICDALNEAGLQIDEPFAPENFESITKFLQDFVVMPPDTYAFLNDKGLVNRDKCPFREWIVNSLTRIWTFVSIDKTFVI